ncbi:hypothetical protein [Ulvibacterium sp.]|uniref:hypothetical protein n=1 Tax=Ulvibacterium sp. TaxID=2665914 RepID=UPI003BAC2CA8
MKKLFSSFFLVLALSCGNDDEVCCTNIDVAASFYVLDDMDGDLLDPGNPGSFNIIDIEVYDVIEGDSIRVFNSGLDAPKGISLLSPEGQYINYRMRMQFDESQGDSNKRVVKWDEEDMDVFVAQFEKGDNFAITTQIALNGEVVWEVDDGERFFIIVK